MNKRSLFEERNHYKALYEQEKRLAAAEIERLEEENQKLREDKSRLLRTLKEYKNDSNLIVKEAVKERDKLIEGILYAIDLMGESEATNAHTTMAYTKLCDTIKTTQKQKDSDKLVENGLKFMQNFTPFLSANSEQGDKP